ncbi:MAG: VTT domain-containing protein [Chloroflexi bacterium]|nr:VTT domain-containing protein [Chloroflexota bacterium]
MANEPGWKPPVPPESRPKVRWGRLVFAFVTLVVLSFGLSFLLQYFLTRLDLPLYEIAWLAYLTVFVVSILTNLSVLVPVPIAVSIMIAAATHWNPVVIALFGALGGTIGELSGYYAGYLGKRIAIAEETPGYRQMERWIRRWGVVAIFLLALQPILPFDLGGFIAGVARMPIPKFLPTLFLGKFPKYIILTYAGVGLLKFIPFLSG